MVLTIYLVSALLLLAAAFVIFRVLVRRDYRTKGHLSPFTPVLELMVLTEEEHLRRAYSQEYSQYCAQTPRYLAFPNQADRVQHKRISCQT